jgi:hypothetical protein
MAYKRQYNRRIIQHQLNREEFVPVQRKRQVRRRQVEQEREESSRGLISSVYSMGAFD